MSVLIAVGNSEMSSILRRHLGEADFDLIENDVLHRNYLHEIIELEQPSMVIVHDYYLPSDFTDEKEREQEFLEMLNYWRINYEGLRVVFLCERARRDPFLGDLVARNVFDIFHENQISPVTLIEQLSAPPRYANASRFGVGNLKIEFDEDEEIHVIEEIVEEQGSTQKKSVEQVEPEIREKAVKPPKPPKPLKEKRDRQLFSDLKERTQERLPKFEKSGPMIKFPSVQIHVHKEKEKELQKLQLVTGRKIILVVSPFQRMGSTFVAHQISHQLAKRGNKVAYYENPFRIPYTFDRFAGHMNQPDFLSEYSSVGGSTREWIHEGVSIQALNPSKEKGYTEEHLSISRFLRMFLSKHDTPYLVVDIGSDTAKAIYEELVEIASHVYVVMEPDIPKMEWFEQHPADPQFSWIHRIKQLDKTRLLINRFSEESMEALPEEEYFTIASLFDEWVFNSQIKGSFAFGSRKSNTAQDEEFYPLYEDIVGKDFIKQSKGRKKSFIPRIKITTS